MKIEITEFVAELKLKKSTLVNDIKAKRKKGLAMIDPSEIDVYNFCINRLQKILKNSSNLMLVDEVECQHTKTHMCNGFITCNNCKKKFY